MPENKDQKKGSGYNVASVQKEIEKDKRIGSKEAKTIHGLLKGWRGDGEPTNADKITAIADACDGLVARFDAYCSRHEERADAGDYTKWQHQGEEARKKGKSKDANPYPHKSEAAYYWSKGFNEGTNN